MKYYAHFGHKDFILCLGYKADVIKDYFLRLRRGRLERLRPHAAAATSSSLNSDIDDWTITFVDTGIDANIGERLQAVRALPRATRTSSSPTTATGSPTST